MCRWLKDLLFVEVLVSNSLATSVGGVLLFTGNISWSDFESSACVLCENFVNLRFEFTISQYTFGYTGILRTAWASSDGMSFVMASSGWYRGCAQQQRVPCEASSLSEPGVRSYQAFVWIIAAAACVRDLQKPLQIFGPHFASLGLPPNLVHFLQCTAA
jgi:hypothetical protein